MAPVPLIQSQNIQNHENSPPPLVIITDQETCSSPTINFKNSPRTARSGEALPSDNPIVVNKTQNYLSNNTPLPTSDETHPVGVNRASKPRSYEEHL